MNFLIYDNNKDDLKQFSYLIDNQHYDFKLDVVSNYDNMVEVYEKNKYDTVLIDFSDDNGKKIISYLQEKKSEQRTILLTDNIECIKEDCSTCKETYNIKKVVKPLNIKDLPLLIKDKDKDCEFDFQKNNLISTLMSITKKYTTSILDKDRLQIKFNEPHKFSISLIQLCEELSENDINYNINNSHIQIMD